MSEIISTDAIVLKGLKFRESSKIVTFFTEAAGKVTGIVKGARQTKNKFGASLEPMSHVALVYYDKRGRDIQTVAACELLTSHRRLAERLENMMIGLAIVEIVNGIAHEEEKNVPLFRLLAGTLAVLNEAEKNVINVLFAFEIRLAALLGFHPSFTGCVSCRRVIDGGGGDMIDFHLDKGGPLCPVCERRSGTVASVSAQALHTLAFIVSEAQEDLSRVTAFRIEKKQRSEIEHLLWMYLRYHVSGIRTLKSRKVFSAILDPEGEPAVR